MRKQTLPLGYITDPSAVVGDEPSDEEMNFRLVRSAWVHQCGWPRWWTTGYARPPFKAAI